MADPRYRSQRSDPYAPDRPSRSASAAKDDPLAELARLIGQDEAFIAASRQNARPRQQDAGRDTQDNSTPNWLGRTAQRARSSESAEHEPEARVRDAAHWAGRSSAGGDWSSATDERDDYRDPEERDQPEWHEPRYGARRYDDEDYRFGAVPRQEEDSYSADEDRYDTALGEDYEERDRRLPAVDPFDSERDRFHEAAEEEEHGTGLRRRGGILTIAAVLGLAAVGTAAAFGYRAWNSSSATSEPPLIKADSGPAKVIPAQTGDAQSNKQIYDRIGEKIQSSNDQLVSREEQPVELRDMARQQPARAVVPGAPGTVSIGAQPPAYAAPPPMTGGAGPDQPKKVHTIPIRPDQAAAASAPDAAPSPIRPLPSPGQTPRSGAAKPNPPKGTPPTVNSTDDAPTTGTARAGGRTQVAALPAPAETGNYVVQLSSQRSESEAQSSFRALQAKYPNVLANRHPLIRRADLGSKGIYYRAQVGPFASSDDAAQLCNELKAAGGQCIVQHN